MKIHSVIGLLLAVLFAGCASTSASKKVPVMETMSVTRTYDVIGPVSVSEQVAESLGDTVQGLAGYASKDTRISSQIPTDTKAALDAKTIEYKGMIFDKLGTEAKSSDADAVIGAEYKYVPAYVNLSSKATVSAKGTMIKYKK